MIHGIPAYFSFQNCGGSDSGACVHLRCRDLERWLLLLLAQVFLPVDSGKVKHPIKVKLHLIGLKIFLCKERISLDSLNLFKDNNVPKCFFYYFSSSCSQQRTCKQTDVPLAWLAQKMIPMWVAKITNPGD